AKSIIGFLLENSPYFPEALEGESKRQKNPGLPFVAKIFEYLKDKEGVGQDELNQLPSLAAYLLKKNSSGFPLYVNSKQLEILKKLKKVVTARKQTEYKIS